MLPFMAVGILKFISFDDYYKKMTGGDIDWRPDADILAEVEEIRKQMRNKDGSV